VVKVRDVVAAIEAAGWVHQRTTGDHHIFVRPGSPLVVTISGKPGDDMTAGQLNDVCRKVGISKAKLKGRRK
jgi:predicted RNA binding protein YcfA (HicA-like mRNA interferase family)